MNACVLQSHARLDTGNAVFTVALVLPNGYTYASSVESRERAHTRPTYTTHRPPAGYASIGLGAKGGYASTHFSAHDYVWHHPHICPHLMAWPILGILTRCDHVTAYRVLCVIDVMDAFGGKHHRALKGPASASVALREMLMRTAPSASSTTRLSWSCGPPPSV